MLRCLDPDATFAWTPPGQDSTPEADRIVVHCRFLSMKATMAFREARIAAAEATNDAEFAAAMTRALGLVVVRIDNLPAGASDLSDVLTAAELWGSAPAIMEAQHEAEQALRAAELAARDARGDAEVQR